MRMNMIIVLFNSAYAVNHVFEPFVGPIKKYFTNMMMMTTIFVMHAMPPIRMNSLNGKRENETSALRPMRNS